MPRNIELLTRVRDAIAAEDAEYPVFNMREFKVPISDGNGHTCGTAACIGGYAVFIADRAAYDAYSRDFECCARELLGLPNNEASWLFYARWRQEANPWNAHRGTTPLHKITREQAIWSLNQIIAKGA